MTGIPGYNGRFVNISPSENPSEDLVEDFVEYYIFDLTLTDEDTNSILTDDANKEISSNMPIQVVSTGGPILNFCKCRHLVPGVQVCNQISIS